MTGNDASPTIPPTRTLRILHVSTRYPDSPTPAIGADTHEGRVAAVASMRDGWSDVIVEELRQCGHHTRLVYANDPWSQGAWAQEAGLGDASMDRVLLGQVREFAPDVVFLQDLYTVARPLRDRIRHVAPGARLVGWRAAPTTSMSEIEDVDLLWSSIHPLVTAARDAGIRAELVMHGFDRRWLLETDRAPRDIAASFVGTITVGGPHDHRSELLRRLLDVPGFVAHLRDGSPPIDPSPRRAIKGALGAVRRGLERAGVPTDRLDAAPPLARARSWRWRRDPPELLRAPRHPAVAGPAFGREYLGLLARSMVVVNQHSQAAETWASNQRLFEATGMGALVLTDRVRGLEDLYDVDQELVTYSRPEEAREKLLELLDDRARLDRIAKAGQARTLRDHTLAARVRLMERHLHELVAT